jgi:hypothetical protein
MTVVVRRRILHIGPKKVVIMCKYPPPHYTAT